MKDRNQRRRARRASNSTGNLPVTASVPEPASAAPAVASGPPPQGSTLILLRITQCHTHPNNMRRIYPVGAVRQMAESIRGVGGLILPMIVFDNGDGSYTVIDGNMRTAGGRLLGEACPLLKAEVVTQSVAQQYLTMAAANLIRYEIDAISEGLHYQRLKAEGLTMLEIAEKCGVYHARIAHRLRLLQLEQPIQDLMAAGKLPIGTEPLEALLGISDSNARLKLCQRMAESSATAKAITTAAIHLRERLEDPHSAASKAVKVSPRRPRPAGMVAVPAIMPMVTLAEEKSGFGVPDRPAAWPALRSGARAMCLACDIKAQTIGDRLDEPAWSLITHAADETCQGCNVREVAGACRGCPGVELLTRLLRGAHPKMPNMSEINELPGARAYERV